MCEQKLKVVRPFDHSGQFRQLEEKIAEFCLDRGEVYQNLAAIASHYLLPSQLSACMDKALIQTIANPDDPDLSAPDDGKEHSVVPPRGI